MANEKIWKETFNRKYTLPAQLNAGAAVCVSFKGEAQSLNKLPHNVLYIANLDLSCILHIFLDDFSDSTKPDYIIFPATTMSIKLDEGVTYEQVWVKNADGVNNIAANNIKVRISTAEKVE